MPTRSKAYGIDPPSRGDVAATAESAREAARSHKVCPARVFLGPPCAQGALMVRWKASESSAAEDAPDGPEAEDAGEDVAEDAEEGDLAVEVGRDPAG